MLRAIFDLGAGALGCATDYQCEQLSFALSLATFATVYTQASQWR